MLSFTGHGEHWNTMQVLDLNYNNLTGLSEKKKNKIHNHILVHKFLIVISS